MAQARLYFPDSIRAKYGCKGDSIKNAVHGSNSREEAIKEIHFFFPECKNYFSLFFISIYVFIYVFIYVCVIFSNTKFFPIFSSILLLVNLWKICFSHNWAFVK